MHLLVSQSYFVDFWRYLPLPKEKKVSTASLGYDRRHSPRSPDNLSAYLCSHYTRVWSKLFWWWCQSLGVAISVDVNVSHWQQGPVIPQNHLIICQPIYVLTIQEYCQSSFDGGASLLVLATSVGVNVSHWQQGVSRAHFVFFFIDLF